MCRRNGSVLRGAPSGPVADGAGPHGASYFSGVSPPICQGAEERQSRCRGDRRGGHTADHAASSGLKSEEQNWIPRTSCTTHMTAWSASGLRLINQLHRQFFSRDTEYRGPTRPGSVQQVGGSGGHCQFRALAGGRLKEVAESRSERAVLDRAADLQQQVCTSSGPSRLLRFVHPPVDQEVRHAFGNRFPTRKPARYRFA